MYHEHFGFHTDPFPLSPSLRFVYRSQPFEETMAHIVYGLKQGEDIILVTGAIGTGKTLALHQLLSLTESSYRQVFINVTQVGYLELLKLIVRDLGLDSSRGLDRADLLLMLRDELRASGRRSERILLVVDEAQNLDLDTLEGLRLLGNLAAPEAPALRTVLSGQLSLEEKLDRPELAQLRQRIRVHYRIEPLTRAEVEEYLQHRLQVAGGAPSLFTRGAVDRIHELSGGVPRLVNHHASKALLAAFVDGTRKVEAAMVVPEGTPPPPLLVPSPPSPEPAARRAPAQPRPAARSAPLPTSALAPAKKRPAAPPPAPAVARAPVKAPAPPATRPATPVAAAHAFAPRSASAPSSERLDELLPPLSWHRRPGRWTLLYITILVLVAFVLAVLIAPSLGDLTQHLGAIQAPR